MTALLRETVFSTMTVLPNRLRAGQRGGCGTGDFGTKRFSAGEKSTHSNEFLYFYYKKTENTVLWVCLIEKMPAAKLQWIFAPFLTGRSCRNPAAAIGTVKTASWKGADSNQYLLTTDYLCCGSSIQRLDKKKKDAAHSKQRE